MVRREVYGHVWEIGKARIMDRFVGDVEKFVFYSKPNETIGSF